MENKVVNLFGDEVILDKLLIVTLDGKLNATKGISIGGLYAGNYKMLCKCLDNKYDVIITPLTSKISSLTMELGYDIIVQSGEKFIRFSEFMLGNTEKSNGKEIRASHNWEKLLYNGCFDLDIPRL